MGRQLAQRLTTRLGASRARAGLLTLAVLAAAAVGLSVGLSSGSAQGGYVDPAAAPVVVKVDPSAVQRRIPNAFLGLSIEYWALENYAGQDPRAVNPVLVRLIRSIMPRNGGSLRIGGVTTDKTWWPVSGVRQSKGINYTLTKRRLQVAGALAHATGSHLIMGVQFEADSTKIARAEAQAMLKYIGRSRLAAFELGNEPELFGNPNFGWYTVNGKPVPGRPPGYDLGVFTRDFAKIGAALPAPPPLAGPSSSVGSWVSDLGTFIRGVRKRLGLVTLHRYPFQACFATPSSPVYPTIARLLSPAGSTDQASGIAPYVSTVHNAGLRLSIDEMNSVSCGNPGRVTNSFAEALWVIDALFADAAIGIDNVDVHTWPGAVYQLFTMSHRGGAWKASVYPEYYGLLLFAQAAPPGASLVQSSTDNGRVRAWATRGSDGVIRVALINDDTGAPHQLSVQIPGSHGRASLALLRAPSVFSTRGVTLANQGFGSTTRTGALGGARRTAGVSPKQGAYSVRLPAASAALLTLR
jgi:hypothetical protein